jgi:hypothetical protein
MNPLVKELRLGNYLQNDEGYIVVTLIGENGMFSYDPFPLTKERSFQMKDYYGIPLTDDVLVKCEFNLEQPGLLKIGAFMFTNEKGNWFFRDEYNRYISKFPIEFLHQFQNFYYFLRGVEVVLGV